MIASIKDSNRVLLRPEEFLLSLGMSLTLKLKCSDLISFDQKLLDFEDIFIVKYYSRVIEARSEDSIMMQVECSLEKQKQCRSIENQVPGLLHLQCLVGSLDLYEEIQGLHQEIRQTKNELMTIQQILITFKRTRLHLREANFAIRFIEKVVRLSED